MNPVISKRSLWYSLLIFLWLPAHALYGWMPQGSNILICIRLVVSAYLILKYWRPFFSNEILIFLSIGVLAGVEIISTGVSSYTDRFDLIKALEFILFIISTYIVFSKMGADEQKDFHFGLRYILILYSIGLFITSMLTNSDIIENLGMYFFVDSRANSSQIMIVLLTILVALDLKIDERVSVSSIVMFIALGIVEVRIHSGQGMTMLAIVLFTIFLTCRKSSINITKFLRPNVVVVLIALLNYMVISQVYVQIQWMVYYIVNVLGKSITISGRNIIFEHIVEIYMGSPIIGFGYNNTAVSSALMSISEGYNSAHNSVFQVLIEVGAIGFGAYVIILYRTLSTLSRKEKKYNVILYGTIFALLIGGLISLSAYNRCFWVLLMFALGTNQYDEIAFGRDDCETWRET